jgi:hypothetical protein
LSESRDSPDASSMSDSPRIGTAVKPICTDAAARSGSRRRSTASAVSMRRSRPSIRLHSSGRLVAIDDDVLVRQRRVNRWMSFARWMP